MTDTVMNQITGSNSILKYVISEEMSAVLSPSSGFNQKGTISDYQMNQI